ncbi:MAG TPA: PAS domain S-box protein [Deltaproteobacteria bacterium]|nr:PAS domain S-box protein [Deltaproteobacteria bacterium]
MAKKPTYEELEQRVKELENETVERKRAEETLKKAQRELKAILDASPALIWQKNTEGKYLRVNQKYCETVGLSRDEVIGKTDYELYPEEIAAKYEQDDRLVIGTGKSQLGITEHHITPSGEVGWSLTDKIVSRDNAGKVSGTIGFALDVTVIKEAEESLRESESFFSQMFEQSTTSTCLYNPDGTISRVNSEFCKMFGVEEKVIIDAGYNVFKDQAAIDAGLIPLLREIFAEKKRKRWEANFDIDVASVSTGTPTSRTGKIFLEVFGYPVLNRNGNLQYVVLQHYDITERKRAEEALRESEERFRGFFNYSPVGINVFDMEGKVVAVNNVARKYFGVSETDSLSGYRFFEDRSITDEAKWKVKHGQVATEERLIDFGVIKESGMYNTTKDEHDRVFIRLTYAAYGQDLNNPVGIIVIIQDLTERKQAEEEHEKLQAHLQQSQKMESIGTLAGGIAHDFNNILGIILGNTELAMDDVPEWNPARNNLGEVRKACLRAKDVVRQILSFSRKSEMEQKPINIAPVVTESLKLLRASIPTSIDIRQNIANDIHDILGDPTQIHQIMINLCTNAAHAMENEGGILEVTLENTEVDEDTASQYPELNPGTYVQLRVTDTGVGISSEIIGRVFDPYFTTKDVGKGTGLGLSVIHGIVSSHHGRISVESKPGKGTTFKILFPSVKEKTKEEPKEPQELPTGKESILFVDDEEPMAKLNQQRLERLGYKVIPETDPSKALEFFRNNSDQIDLIITDMTMPRMTGDRLAQEILKIKSDIPIIICTGYSQRMSEDKAQELGIRKYIEKPIEMKNLARSVREVLDGQ